MKILVCGAQGFLGRHICQTLQESGHEIIAAQRQSDDDHIAIDFAIPVSVEQWEKRLLALQQRYGELDIVVNAVGILKESRNQSFSAIHDASPRALFQAADKLGLKAIVQISALGPINEHQRDTALSAYLQSKRQADASLKRLNIPYLVLRPSLVVGEDGASSKLFRTLASLPLIVVPGDGEQQIQPVHIDDLCAAIGLWVKKIEAKEHSQMTLNAVGPHAMSYRSMMLHYRNLMGLSAPWIIGLPMFLMWMSAWLAQWLPQKIFVPETLRMLCQHNVADARAFSRFLGHEPIGPQQWFNTKQSQQLMNEAIATLSSLILRFSLASVWIISGVVSLFIYPREASYELLNSVGITATFAPFVLLAAAFLDIILGMMSLMRPSRVLWIAQIVLICIYSVIVIFALPEYLAQPFGPITKNIPIIAVLVLLNMQRERRST